MPGKRITNQQIEIYMQNRKNRKTQQFSAAKSGFSIRSGRNIEKGKRKMPRPRIHKTRYHALDDLWEAEAIPLLESGIFEATFLLQELIKKFPDLLTKRDLRTTQRRVRDWRVLNEKRNKEVMFPQVHEPGQLGISDFTHLKDVEIFIKGEKIEFVLYHFRMPYSGFNYMDAFLGKGEPFTAFSKGLQDALFMLGGVPTKHRTDSLSASYKNLNQQAAEDLTSKYAALIEHYQMEAERINRGKGHENGAVESSHRHIKDRMRQLLIVRGSTAFETFDEFKIFVADVVKQHNQNATKNLDVERDHLKPLPISRTIEYDEKIVVVSTSSTMEVKRVTYSVPSNFIGLRLSVRVYHDVLMCYFGLKHVVTLQRMKSPPRGKRARKIDYRHVINWLVRKPGAFRGCKYRDNLLPSDNYKYIWQFVDDNMEYREAAKFMVGLLHIAAIEECENSLAEMVMRYIHTGRKLKLSEFQDAFKSTKRELKDYSVSQHQLALYDQLIPYATEGLV